MKQSGRSTGSDLNGFTELVFGTTGYPFRKKKIKLDPFLKPQTRINSKFTRDLNIKSIKRHGMDDNLGVGGNF